MSDSPARCGRFVAVLMPDPPTLAGNDHYYGPMLLGLSEKLLAGGLCIRPIQAMHDYQQSAFLSRRTDDFAGVVFAGLFRVDSFVGEVARRYRDVPKVVLDHHYDELPVHSVREDAGEGMRQIVEHLVGLGHRRIAYIDEANPKKNPWKRKGVIAGLEKHGIELPKGWIAGCRYLPPEGLPEDVRRTDVHMAMEWLAALEPRPTAVICCDDMRAYLAALSAEVLGLSVPGDFSITGFGDAACRTGLSEKLTSLRLDPKLLGERAAEILLGPTDAPPEAELMPLELVVRSSTGPAAG